MRGKCRALSFCPGADQDRSSSPLAKAARGAKMPSSRSRGRRSRLIKSNPSVYEASVERSVSVLVRTRTEHLVLLQSYRLSTKLSHLRCGINDSRGAGIPIHAPRIICLVQCACSGWGSVSTCVRGKCLALSFSPGADQGEHLVLWPRRQEGTRCPLVGREQGARD